MKHVHFLLLTIAAALLGSCKSQVTSATEAPALADTSTVQTLFPLAYGDYWIYHSQIFDPQDSVLRDMNRTLEVTRSETRNGHLVYIVNDNTLAFEDVYYYTDSVLFGGLVAPNSSATVDNASLHFPMAPGEKRILSDVTSDTIHLVQELIFKGNAESVTVPAGTFICHHFQNVLLEGFRSSLDTITIDNSYYASGVRLVLEDNSTYNINTKEVVSKRVDQLINYNTR